MLFINVQGDAEYLRYHGMQEFDRAMQHLEESYGVSLSFAIMRFLLFAADAYIFCHQF